MRVALSSPESAVRRTLAWTMAGALLVFAVPLAQAEEVIRVWTRSSNDARKTYDAIAEAFQKKTGIRVDYFNAMTDYEQRLARAAAGNDLPDIVINDTGSLGQFVTMGLAAEIDRAKIKGAEDIHDRAWKSARAFDGKYYAVPTSAQAFVLFIRKDWRTKLGLPLPQNWKDIEALAQAFTERDPDGNGKQDTYGFVFPGSTTRGYASWFMSSYLWQAGGDFLRPVGTDKFKGALDETAAATTIKFFRGLLCEHKAMQPGAINATTAEAIPAFRSGQAGMFFSGPYHISVFDKEPGQDKIEVVQAPPGPKTSDVLAEGEVAYIMKASQKKAAAQSFIEFLVSPEGQIMGMTTPGGLPIVRLPVNKKVDVGSTYRDPRWQLVADAYATHGHYVPTVPNWQPIRQLTADGFNRLLARCDSDIDAGLKELNKKVNEELAKQKVLAD
jgi:multiple sugar transport system substrate-binding protein